MVQGMHDWVVTGSLRELARRFPAVVILDVWQGGKATLACCAVSLRPYLGCDDSATSGPMNDDARFVLASGVQGGLVLDESQAVAIVFNAILGLIDEAPAAQGVAGQMVTRGGLTAAASRNLRSQRSESGMRLRPPYGG